MNNKSKLLSNEEILESIKKDTTVTTAEAQTPKIKPPKKTKTKKIKQKGNVSGIISIIIGVVGLFFTIIIATFTFIPGLIFGILGLFINRNKVYPIIGIVLNLLSVRALIIIWLLSLGLS